VLHAANLMKYNHRLCNGASHPLISLSHCFRTDSSLPIPYHTPMQSLEWVVYVWVGWVGRYDIFFTCD